MQASKHALLLLFPISPYTHRFSALSDFLTPVHAVRFAYPVLIGSFPGTGSRRVAPH